MCRSKSSNLVGLRPREISQIRPRNRFIVDLVNCVKNGGVGLVDYKILTTKEYGVFSVGEFSVGGQRIDSSVAICGPQVAIKQHGENRRRVAKIGCVWTKC